MISKIYNPATGVYKHIDGTDDADALTALSGVLGIDDPEYFTEEQYRETQHYADKLTENALGEYKRNRKTNVSKLLVEVDDLVFDANEISQGRMNRAVTVATSDSETTLWKLADNTVAEVTAKQLKAALRLAGQAQTTIWMTP